MGNNLCAPLWKKPYRDGEYPWYPKKDSHLLRLWAEVFRVVATDGELAWERISEDVVPINITCIQAEPDTIFQVTAYSRHVEKIFDTRLIQPGTKINQSSECFVHWRDQDHACEWGLNFTTAIDSRRFIDCCETQAHRLSARKATSSTSLRLSPPKRARGGNKKAISAPSSPTSNKPRRTVSSPDDLASQGHEFRSLHSSLRGIDPRMDPRQQHSHMVDSLATMPRMRHGNGTQPYFQDPRLRLSGSNSRDNLSVTLPRKQIHSENIEHLKQQLKQFPPRQNSDPVRVMSQSNRQNSDPGQQYVVNVSNHPALDALPRKSILKNRQDSSSNSSSCLDRHDLPIWKPQDHAMTMGLRSRTPNPTMYHTNLNIEPRSRPPQRSASALGERQAREFQPSRSLSIERKMLETSINGDQGAMETTTTTSYSSPNVSEQNHNTNNRGDDRSSTRISEVSTLSTASQSTVKERETSLPHQQQSQDQGSPDWPPPPEPLSPCSPEVPPCEANFDSDTLKRMLQSLPLPGEGTEYRDYDELEFSMGSPVTQSQPVSPVSAPSPTYAVKNEVSNLHRTQSLGRRGSRNLEMNMLDELDAMIGAKNSRNKGAKKKEAKYGRDSYPDSGVSGMTADTSDIQRAATLPAGFSRKEYEMAHSGSPTRDLDEETSRTLPRSNLHMFEMSANEDSDDEDSDSSSIHTLPSESQSALSRRTGAVRKAGWLIVKNWLIHKKRKIDLAPKRTWKKYWVCLKGTVLLFFLCDDMGEVSHDAVPRHLLVIEGGIAQAVPEHPKRENIFALSTAYGDAYLFQAPSQIDLDNWISAIHSACASLFARQHGKDNTLKLLKSEVNRLEGSIDMDIKMKKMADLQLNVVTDPRSKTAIVKQIAQWDENLEKLYMEQYRLRCYVASLQGAELPNPKTILGNVSKHTKQLLNRLGVFTLTAFHAQIGARSPGQSSSKYYRSSRSRKGKSRNTARTPSDASKHPPLLRMDHIDEGRPDTSGSGEASPVADNLARVILPNRQQIIVPVTDQMTFAELLESVCDKRRLSVKDHFIRLRLSKGDVYATPKRLDLVKKQNYEAIEVCQKIMFQCELSKSETHGDFGLCIEAELSDDSDKGGDCLCVFISNIRKGSHAEARGLMVGDEIVVINGRVIADLDMVYIECLFHELDSVHLTVRSCRAERPRPNHRSRTPVKYREPGYSQTPTLKLGGPKQDQTDSQPTAYKVDDQSDSPSSKSDINVSSNEQITQLIQNAEYVSDICRKEAIASGSLRPFLSEAQKLRKCIMELIDTERQYVKDLNFLTECYLEPLKQETSLSIEEIEQLFGNIQEIVQFQRQFLQSLEEAIDLQSDFGSLVEPKQFRHILFSLGGSFLYYANHFKLYSSFCASHSKMQKVLNPGEWRKANEVLRIFLSERNPKQQHSATLESYLIKPIQRILKYPLLLQQLKMLTNPDTDEHYHLSEAQRGMETVAEHINEMQKIYEEYGATFLELMKLYREAHPQRPPIDLNIGELQMYGIVEWLNASADLGKIKKGQELLTSCFVFKAGVVLLCKERVKQKKKTKGNASSKAPTPEILEFVRFQTLIPVNEVQVRTSAQESGPIFWWELVHLRLTPDGRQEKIYQLANSTGDARNDFLRTIRQIIRDSVRKMSPPIAMPRLGICSAFKPYVPPMARPADSMPKNPRSVAKRRIMQIEGQTERHSVDVPENYQGMEFEEDLGPRSNTTGALNNVQDMGDSQEGQPGDIAASSISAISTTSSTSQVSTQERPGSARLLFASNNPLTYSSTSIALSDASNSPIWKPRPNTLGKKPVKRGIRAHFAEHHDRPSSSHAYGDYSSVLIDKKTGSACSTPRQRSLLESVEDTEC